LAGGPPRAAASRDGPKDQRAGNALTRSLVTGGAGFIGSNLVDALVARGDEVTVVDDLSRGNRSNLAGALGGGASLVEADVRDATPLNEVVDAARPELVFHLAAQISVRQSATDPGADAELNVLGTVNVLEASRRAGARRLVNASTGGPIYGAAAPQPTSESEPPSPKSPYGQSKLAAEGFCGLYGRVHGLSTISLRCGNVYGPRQDPEGEAGVVAIFCGRLLTGRTATIFGDGHQQRDFIHVDDVVAANLRAAEVDVESALNIATGVGSSVLDLARILGKAGRGALAVEHGPPRQGEAGSTVLDPTEAAELLGWQAEIPFEDGVSRTLRSFALE
jgi:UDP-glucose 4-epimerase